MIMTDEEILREYRQARYPMKQIGILADENQCSRREIADLLLAAGAELPGQCMKKKLPQPPAGGSSLGEGAGGRETGDPNPALRATFPQGKANDGENDEEEKAMENVKIIPAPEGAGEFQPEFQAELGTGEGLRERVCRGTVDAVAQLLAESDRARDAAAAEDDAWAFREQVRGVLSLVYQLTVEDEDE